MSAFEGLSGSADVHEAEVEGILEHLPDGIGIERPTVPAAQSHSLKLASESVYAVRAGIIEFKAAPDERPHDGVNFLELPTATVDIAGRCSERIESLLQAAFEPLACLVPEIPYVVGRENSLDVG